MSQHITYKHRCARCGDMVVSANVAGLTRWAHVQLDAHGKFRKWQYVCYDGSAYSPRPKYDWNSGEIEQVSDEIQWHVGVPMDSQEVEDLDLLNAVAGFSVNKGRR